MTDFDAIPVIDLAPLGAPLGDPDCGARDRLAAAFRDAYENIGFSYVVNHGVDSELIAAVFAASRAFHALPRADKQAVRLNANHRGFIAIDTSTDRNSKLAGVTKPNQSESFIMMREAGPEDPDVEAGAYLAGPNLWPEALPGFREAAARYDSALGDLGSKLVRVIALALDTDPDDFARAFDPPTTFLRLLHYPPRPPMTPDDLYGSAPHCDFGFITILAQDEAGGLQVRNTAGAWIDAPYLPGAFVVNTGDMLHRWSNGRLRSTPHRVINRSGRARYSCPFFFDPHVGTEIAPLESCIGPDRPAAFEPIVYGEFLRAELSAGYEAHGGKRAGA